ncbi:heterogeneous nuclear ribonucleoprotein A/B-like [Brachypodium distachyon]|uniref:heterogeneous nuclear ribonucleoprotein A/B-like n=1 Tax=Brachypodium distachyon TaxID=15368 RepID=UPI000D0DB9EF|nr:heterogeneous nuclear ribonucleoprotein A/B-like [Brachypodium distachyon]|eukprot:XP_024314248.1 heterogeneous nuclear ribonucleoprotein A/B-like [Brachypodium distachyon]
MPPKKRFLRNASTLIPTPPPTNAPATAAETLVLPTASPQPPVTESGLLLPPPPKAADPSTPPIPAAEAKLPTTPPSAPGAAAAEPAPEQKVRKHKVIKRIVKVPKGTLAARKDAAAAAAASADGAGAKPNETLGDKGCNNGCSHLCCKEGQSCVTNCKLAAAAAAAREALIKRKQLLLEKQTLAAKPAIDCNNAPVEGVKEGGLHYDAKEEDVRAVFSKAGEITQVHVIPNTQTWKNQGYCFVQYREAAHAKKAIEELGNVKICGKRCRTAALDGNNIDKKRKKEDIRRAGAYQPEQTYGDRQ